MKLWGWSYLHEGKPRTITYKDRPVLILDESLPSQYRQVMRVLRLLNSAEGPAKKKRPAKPRKTGVDYSNSALNAHLPRRKP